MMKMSSSDDVSTFFSDGDLLLVGLSVKGGFTEFSFDESPYIEIEGVKYFVGNVPEGEVGGIITDYKIENASLDDYEIVVKNPGQKYVLSYKNLSFKLTITETTKTGETPVARELSYNVNLCLDSDFDMVDTGKILVDYVVDGKDQPSFRLQAQITGGFIIDFGDYRCTVSP